MDPRRIKSRQKLKNGLLVLLDKKSLDQISIEEISAQADVSRPTFYSNFGDSQAIIMELVNEWFEGKNQLLISRRPNADEFSLAFLATYFRYLFGLIEDDGKLLCIALSGRAGEDVLEAAQSGLINTIPYEIWGELGFSKSNARHMFLSYGFCGIVASVCDTRLRQSQQDLGYEVANLLLNCR